MCVTSCRAVCRAVVDGSTFCRIVYVHGANRGKVSFWKMSFNLAGKSANVSLRYVLLGILW